MTELTIERVFPADAATVFAFVTKSENLVKWWGPEGMSLPDCNLDLSQPGAAWHSVMMNSDGARFKVSGEVVSVNPPHSVEFTWGWHDENDQRGHSSRVRFDVAPTASGEGALFRLTHSELPDDESAANHSAGWTSSFRKLSAGLDEQIA